MGCLKLSYEENKSPLYVSANNFGSSQKEVLELTHFELRMYDPLIGRWLQVDPMREFASPYVMMGNYPHATDPTGGICDGCTKTERYASAINSDQNYIYDAASGEYALEGFEHLLPGGAASVIDGSNAMFSSIGVGQPLNTSLTTSFEQAQMEAGMEATLLVNMVAAFLDPRSENHGDAENGEIAMSPPMIGGPAKSIRAYKDWNKARNAAIAWLEKRGFRAQQKVLGKFGNIKGKPIGMKTLDSKIGFRVEHDARHGAHINAWAGKEKITFTVENVSEQTIQYLQNLYK